MVRAIHGVTSIMAWTRREWAKGTDYGYDEAGAGVLQNVQKWQRRR